jgi:prolipoprotein diacylglyceryltransferase
MWIDTYGCRCQSSSRPSELCCRFGGLVCRHFLAPFAPCDHPGDYRVDFFSIDYVSLYSAGRFFVETLRIDPAFIIGSSFRGNLLVSGVLAVGFALILILRHRRTPRARPDPD